MPGKLEVWAQGPMRRIFPNDPAPGRSRGVFEISAARGETECFQVGVRAEGIQVNYLSAQVAALTGPGDAVIPAAHIDVLYPEFVPVKWPCGGQTPEDVEHPAPAFFPDPLAPEWVFDVAGPQAPPARSIWVRVRVPRDARAGVYEGCVSVVGGRRNFKAENQAEATQFEQSYPVRFRLRVWDFELPERTGLLTTNWFFPDHLADWYGQEMWSPGHWKLVERVAEDMAQHRQNVIKLPFFGGGRAEEPGVSVQRRGKTYSFDFRRFDRLARVFLGKGFELLEGQHVAGGSRTPFAFWERSGQRAPRLVRFEDAADPGFENFLLQFFSALWEHLDRRRWRERFIQHISDEPKMPELDRYRRLAELIRGAAPGIRFLDAITDPEFAEMTDFPVPLENTYQRIIEEADCPRENVWAYYCCGPGGPWPNRFIEYLLVRVRIIAWICFQKGIPGFLHWGYNYWVSAGARNRKDRYNPWDDPTDHRHPGGDPCVVYPPRDARMLSAYPDEIIGSIRWEILREGLEDYEYLTMTRRLAEDGNAEARRILAEVGEKVVPDWTTHTRDDAYLSSVRDRMGKLLSDAR